MDQGLNPSYVSRNHLGLAMESPFMPDMVQALDHIITIQEYSVWPKWTLSWLSSLRVSRYVLMTEADGEGWQKPPESTLP